jgi:hypothetical protein
MGMNSVQGLCQTSSNRDGYHMMFIQASSDNRLGIKLDLSKVQGSNSVQELPAAIDS